MLEHCSGFTAEVNRRAGKGRSFQVSYNWAKSLSDPTGCDGGRIASENGSVFPTTLSYFQAEPKGQFGVGRLSGILPVPSGPCFPPPPGNVRDPSGAGLNTRASDGNLDLGPRTVDAFWDRSAFTVLGSLIGPMTCTLSMKIQETFAAELREAERKYHRAAVWTDHEYADSGKREGS